MPVHNQTQYPTDRRGCEQKTAYLLYLDARRKWSASRPEHFTRSETTMIPTGQETGCFTEPVYLHAAEKILTLTVLMSYIYIYIYIYI